MKPFGLTRAELIAGLAGAVNVAVFVVGVAVVSRNPDAVLLTVGVGVATIVLTLYLVRRILPFIKGKQERQ